MIISNFKDGTTLAGTPLELTHEATTLFGAMLERTPEILLTVLTAYVDELEKLNPDNYTIKMGVLSVIAEESKKGLKESKSYGN